jgi:hypothetical protein
MKDAKGHGSNKRGIHSAAVDRVGNIALHPNVLNMIRKNPGGFSVKPTNGQSPTSGFMVSLPGHTRIVNESDLSGPNGAAIMKQYAQEHAGALQQPGAHIGGWTDAKSGKTYLDVSQNIRGKSAAVEAGRTRNQIAIWDVKHAREINTGGTGE